LIIINIFNCKVPRVLVGNKIDSQKRVVLKDDAEKLAKSKKLAYFESSAKDNVGISEIFLHLTQLALAKKMGSNKVKDESEKMDLNLKKKKKSGCC
jgi:GTPase SAR1 family protein